MMKVQFYRPAGTVTEQDIGKDLLLDGFREGAVLGIEQQSDDQVLVFGEIRRPNMSVSRVLLEKVLKRLEIGG